MDRLPFEQHISPPITVRQHRILVLMAEGLGYEKIAERMYLSSRTVERDIAKAAQALGAQSHVALGAIAYAKGILHDEHLLKQRSRDCEPDVGITT